MKMSSATLEHFSYRIIPVYTSEGSVVYYAVCTCGWESLAVPTRPEANAAGHAHITEARS